MKKTLLVGAVIMVLMTILIACSDSSNNKNDSSDNQTDNAAQPVNTEPPVEKEDVKLAFSIWGSEAHKGMYEGIAAKYKEIHPHVSVDIQIIPYADYQQKMSIMLASKTAPDIAWVHEVMIPQLLATDQFLDISSVSTDVDYNFDDIFPSTLDMLKKDNKNYGVAFSTPPMLMTYNKTLFEAKGLKTPTELYKEGKWNFEEFLKAANAIADPKNGVYGLRTSGNWSNWTAALHWLIRSYGASILSPDGTTFTLNTPEGELALQTYIDMIFKDQSHPKPGDQTAFDSGKIGMQPGLYSAVAGFRSIKDFEWDIAPLPEGPGGSGVQMGYAGYAVMKDTKHPEEAISFLKFMSNKENMITTSEFFVPSRKSVIESDEFLNKYPHPSAESIKIALLDQLSKAWVFVVPANWQEINVKLGVDMDYLYTQQQTVKEVLEIMEKNASSLMTN